tara:strand:+ start:879 stop:1055 length:177 start_codon:yes stop_codon:yes gene_type:complete
LTGGQGVASSNLAVPTPIQNKETSHTIEGFFLSTPFNQTFSNFTLNEQWVGTDGWEQG